MRNLLFVSSLFLGLALTGCGPSGAVRVTGKIVSDGSPYMPPPGQKLAVALIALDVKDSAGSAVPASEPFWAVVNPADSSFTVPGVDGWGIFPGKYRISIVQELTRDGLKKSDESVRGKGRKAALSRPDRDTDFLKNQFGPENSALVREIKESGEIIVDMKHPS